MSNSGIESELQFILADHATHARNLKVIERREAFARRHPEIDIRAQRVPGARLAFNVQEPDMQICWLDGTAMMNDLETRYP